VTRHACPLLTDSVKITIIGTAADWLAIIALVLSLDG
jgi:hypothetical protein